MTESIFVPFRLTTREACEKAAKVLTSEATPWPKTDSTFHLMNKDEAVEFFKKRENVSK